MPDKKFMSIAIEQALEGMRRRDGGPFGAVIVKGERVLSACHNTVFLEKDPTKHAEINAISGASRATGSLDLAGCDIYSTTEPCPMCFSAIHWARIDRVFFGTGIEDVKALGFNELGISSGKMKGLGGSRVEIEGGFMLVECRVVLEEWKELPGGKVY